MVLELIPFPISILFVFVFCFVFIMILWKLSVRGKIYRLMFNVSSITALMVLLAVVFSMVS